MLKLICIDIKKKICYVILYTYPFNITIHNFQEDIARRVRIKIERNATNCDHFPVNPSGVFKSIYLHSIGGSKNIYNSQMLLYPI